MRVLEPSSSHNMQTSTQHAVRGNRPDMTTTTNIIINIIAFFLPTNNLFCINILGCISEHILYYVPLHKSHGRRRVMVTLKNNNI